MGFLNGDLTRLSIKEFRVRAGGSSPASYMISKHISLLRPTTKKFRVADSDPLLRRYVRLPLQRPVVKGRMRRFTAALAMRVIDRGVEVDEN